METNVKNTERYTVVIKAKSGDIYHCRRCDETCGDLVGYRIGASGRLSNGPPRWFWLKDVELISKHKSTAQRVREAEASHRARGEREIRLWVPDNPTAIQQVRDLAAKLCQEAQPDQLGN